MIVLRANPCDPRRSETDNPEKRVAFAPGFL
jgi:hypothetical protein